MKQVLLGIVIGVCCTVVFSNVSPRALAEDASGFRGASNDASALRGDGRNATAIGLSNCPSDLTGDGLVDVSDLLVLLASWGPCPGGCQSGAECNDGDPCTMDICDNGNCIHIPIPGCCQVDTDCGPNGVCLGAQCGCMPGFLDCDSDFSNGCETNINTDPNNCGTCGNVCSPGDLCINGACVTPCQTVFYIDVDQDGWGDCNDFIIACAPTGLHTATVCGDCDDTDPTVYPGAPEFCNGIDNDCNGIVDDNVVDCPPGTICDNAQCVTP